MDLRAQAEIPSRDPPVIKYDGTLVSLIEHRVRITLESPPVRQICRI